MVKQGEVLFEIDHRPYQAALDQANAKLGKTELDVKRYTPLAKRKPSASRNSTTPSRTTSPPRPRWTPPN